MEIKRIWERTPALVDELTEVWRASVRETHHFLTAAQMEELEPYVRQALAQVAVLEAAFDPNGRAAGFLGVEDGWLEMLFLAPERRGQGLGRRMLARAVQKYGVERLTVNEQNPAARGFYERMGFAVCARSETDGQGNPFPILTMRRAPAGE